MRYLLMLLGFLLYPVSSVATTQVSVGVSIPGLSIGINLPAYPELVRVPGYPVYYAPQLAANYFFYDGMYWVYAYDDWYASRWFNGPWELVYPQYVPLFILRIPVYYYRRPPPYFRDWRRDAPPRWGQHWGRDWERDHRSWNQWDRRAAPRPAPLPSYQREYSGERYPQPGQQLQLQKQYYPHEPADAVVRQHYQREDERRAAPPARQYQDEGPRDHDNGRDQGMPGRGRGHWQDDGGGHDRGR